MNDLAVYFFRNFRTIQFDWYKIYISINFVNLLNGIDKNDVKPLYGDNKYHFVNITHNHICTCAFNNVQDAINDMDNLKKNGKILDYYKIG